MCVLCAPSNFEDLTGVCSLVFVKEIWTHLKVASTFATLCLYFTSNIVRTFFNIIVLPVTAFKFVHGYVIVVTIEIKACDWNLLLCTKRVGTSTVVRECTFRFTAESARKWTKSAVFY